MKTQSMMCTILASMLIALTCLTVHADRNIPRTEDLLFSAMTSSFPSNGYNGNWTTFMPAGALTVIATPTVESIAGRMWVRNKYSEGDGYRQGFYPNPANAIPCNGISAFAVVIPTRNGQGAAWHSVIDVMYNVVRLGVRNDSGVIIACRNGTGTDSATAIPDRQMTILSMVVQPDGQYKVWANGTEVINVTDTNAMTSLYPSGAAPEEYKKYINIGRNNPDGWTTFNGDIGDVFFYTNALNDTERQQLEADLYTNFFSTARTITKSPSDQTTTSVTLNGEMLTEGFATPTEVTVYYGTSNGGQDPAGWTDNALVGSAVGVGAFSKGIAALTPGTLYYFSFYATNAAGESWSDYVGTFSTPDNPIISNEPPYSVRVSTARARGNLVSTNFAPTTVILYHGTTDGGTVPGSWQHADNLGVLPNGRLDTVITNITGTYHYRYYASNLAGGTWADATETFTPTDTPFNAKADGYLRALEIVFSGYAGATVLADYPALVKLNEASIPGFAYSQFQSESNDLRFTAADGSLLSYEIESWNPAGDSFVWVRVPVLVPNTLVRMFYSKPGEVAPTDATNTWDDGFAGVWHLASSMSPNATGNTAYDTSFKQGTQTNAAGVAGTAQWCNQSANSYMRVGDVDLGQTLTMSYWAYRQGEGTTGDQWNFDKDGSYGLWNQYGNWRTWVVAWYDTTAGYASTDNVWAFLAGTYDGGALRMYGDGVLKATTTKSVTVTQNNNSLEFGQNFNGMLDEVRCEYVARSADWLLAVYQNLTTPFTFATYVASNLTSSLPQVDITNVTGIVDLPGSTVSYRIEGTNNSFTVGRIVWSNDLTGVGGSVPASATGWAFTVGLVAGDNVIRMIGTNTMNLSAADSVTLRIPGVMVTTEMATDIGSFGATMNGTVNPNDVVSLTWFEYGADTNYGSTTAASPAGSGNTYVPCSNVVGSLTPDTTYHFRAMASNLLGQAVAGSDMSFKTMPLIQTLFATNIQASAAVLNGRANPNGAASQGWFEWGLNTSYGNETPHVGIGSGSAYVPFSADISGLAADQVYHFRAVVSDGGTTLYGEDKAFIAGRNITQNGLYFCVLASSVPDIDGAPTGPWAQALPADGTTFPIIGAPTVSISNGVKRVRNYRDTWTGFSARDLSSNPQIPCNGVTIVANVQPIYWAGGGEQRGEVVDIFFDRLALAVAHSDGHIMVARNYWNDNGPSLPENVNTVLSLVVQPDGSYTCYTNGAAAMVGAANGAFTNMVPSSDTGFKKFVTIGRSAPDGWSSYNGLLGDIFVYTNALTDEERMEVEKIAATGGPIDITNVAGTVVLDSSLVGTPFVVAGTNSDTIVGDILWTNSLSDGGVVPANSDTGWTFATVLANGANVITVSGTNVAGETAVDVVTIVVPEPAAAASLLVICYSLFVRRRRAA